MCRYLFQQEKADDICAGQEVGIPLGAISICQYLYTSSGGITRPPARAIISTPYSRINKSKYSLSLSHMEEGREDPPHHSLRSIAFTGRHSVLGRDRKSLLPSHVFYYSLIALPSNGLWCLGRRWDGQILRLSLVQGTGRPVIGE